MSKVINYIRAHLLLAKETIVTVANGEVRVMGIRVARITITKDSTLLTFSGTGEVVDINKVAFTAITF